MMHYLDLRGIACPMNFVKTRLYLDTLAKGDILAVSLDAGEPIESVYASVLAEGHKADSPEIKSDGSYVLTITKIATCLLLIIYCFSPSFAWSQTAPLNVSDLQEQIKLAQQAAILSPTDTAKRLHFARLLRRSGSSKQAAIEYLNITAVDPACHAAYHEMLLCKPAVGQVDEAIARLNKLDEIKPKQLLTKMQLSELYEHREDYYQAARVLVDLQYSQTIPPKYVPQIASRIHMLLGKTKDIRTTEKAIEQKTNVEESEFTPPTPVPMPDVAVTKNVPVNKLRNTRVKEGYGHAQLLP